EVARPPVRLQANSSTKLSLKATQTCIDEFLNDFQNRSTPSKGGDTTITAQLEKLSKALKEQRARNRKQEELHGDFENMSHNRAILTVSVQIRLVRVGCM
ncbi:hypothetical protein BU15DRAFT_49139, partial [Melanogaster broomeanus]